MSRIIEEAKNKLHQATHHGQPKSEFEQDRERILPPQVERVLDGIEQATHHDIGPANYQKGSTMDRVMDKAGEYLGHGHHRGGDVGGTRDAVGGTGDHFPRFEQN